MLTEHKAKFWTNLFLHLGMLEATLWFKVLIVEVL